MHALAIIAMDTSGELANRLLPQLTGKVRDVATSLMDGTISRDGDIASAVSELKQWANKK